MPIDQGKCVFAATAIEVLLKGLDCSDDERLTVLGNVSAWTWRDVAPEKRDAALLAWLSLVKQNAEEPRREKTH